MEAPQQRNIYSPKLAFYDITNKEHAFAIHLQLNYLLLNKEWLERYINFRHKIEDVDPAPHNTIQVTEPMAVITTQDLGLLLNKKKSINKAKLITILHYKIIYN